MLELKSAVLLLIFCLLSLLLFSCLSVDYLNIRSPSWFIYNDFGWVWASLVAQRLKRLPPMPETRVWSLGQEDPLEKEMATHSSILPWRIPWTEEPGGLQSTGSQRVGHNWVTLLYLMITNLIFYRNEPCPGKNLLVFTSLWYIVIQACSKALFQEEEAWANCQILASF